MGALTSELGPAARTGDTRELVPFVLRHCAGKSDGEIRAALVDALRRFCQEAKAWRTPLFPQPEVAGDPAYRFTAASSGLIHAVCEVRSRGGTRPPPAYTCEDGRTVLFDEAIPVDEYPYAAMVPERGDDHAPVDLLAKWGEAIGRLALHELAAGGALAAATNWKAQYDNAVSEALLDAQPEINGTIRADFGVEVI